jgi:chaperonin GroEL (HSP60 family)
MEGADGLLREGAAADDQRSLREQQLAAARWLDGFLAPGYGPHGASKLVVATSDGDATWVRSPALALRETARGPLLAPYVDLATRVHQAVGDGATTSVLLAVRLVAVSLRDASPTAPSWTDGYRLAWRQARGWLAAQEQPCRPEQAVAHVAEPGWAGVAVRGLESMARQAADHPLDLDAVDVRAEPDGPAWLDGVVLAAKEPPRKEGRVGVLLLNAAWSGKLRSENVQATMRTAAHVAGFGQAEDAARRRAAAHLAALDVGLLVCSKAVDEGLRGLLQDAGVTVWTDAPLSAFRRLESSTGAVPVARLEDATAADIGAATLAKRPRRGWLVRGKGPSATLVVPAHSAPSAQAAVEAGERLLRAAGAVLPEPRAIPGGGRWQRGLAASLRKAADLAPGKGPIAVRAAAEVVDALADDLLRNAGRDALAGGVLPDAESVLDPARGVRLAVGGAFETAIAILRLDGAYARRPSSAAGLRGGLGPSGSPKGMPGDIPPLM